MFNIRREKLEHKLKGKPFLIAIPSYKYQKKIKLVSKNEFPFWACRKKNTHNKKKKKTKLIWGVCEGCKCR